MKYLMSILAIVMFSFAITGCSSVSVCDQYCDKVDECTGSTVTATCKDTFAQSMSANADVTTQTCQDALDVLNGANGCAAGDDDDSAS